MSAHVCARREDGERITQALRIDLNKISETPQLHLAGYALKTAMFCQKGFRMTTTTTTTTPRLDRLASANLITRRLAIVMLATAPLAITLMSGTAAAQDATASPEASREASPGASLPSYQEFTIKATDTGFEVSATVPAGRSLITFENLSKVGVGLMFWTLADGTTVDSLKTELPPRQPGSVGAAPAAFYTADLPGAPGYAEAGNKTQAVIDLPAGNYAIVTEEGAWPTPFTAVAPDASGATPETLPDPVADVDVQLVDFAFGGIPTTASAGKHIWKATNNAAEPHQLIVGKVPDGLTLDEVLEGFIPPKDGTPDPRRMTRADFVALGGIEIMSGGHSAWALLDFVPGTYAVVCLVPDKSGMLHVQMGMAAVFEVTA